MGKAQTGPTVDEMRRSIAGGRGLSIGSTRSLGGRGLAPRRVEKHQGRWYSLACWRLRTDLTWHGMLSGGARRRDDTEDVGAAASRTTASALYTVHCTLSVRQVVAAPQGWHNVVMVACET